MVTKFPFLPGCLFNTPCKISLNAEGISEDGEPIQGSTAETKCVYQAKSGRKLTKDGTYVDTSGTVIVNGDVFPDENNISSGTVDVSGQIFDIFNGLKARNADGTVHHTEFTVV